MPRPHVHVEAADPLRATSAARATAAAAIGAFPRRRAITGVLIGWADLPGLAVSPWVLRGVIDAIPEEVAHGWEPLELPRASDRALRSVPQDVRRDARALERGATGERRVPLSISGQSRSAAVPRAWVGTSLCVVAPLCHGAAHERRGDRLRARVSSGLSSRAHPGNRNSSLGPVQRVLIALARRCGMDGAPAAMTRAGARIVSDVFCDALLVVDATWWAGLDAHGAPMGDPTAVEHCLGTGSLRDPRDAIAIDAWLGALLGHPRGSTSHPTPKISGRRKAWPETSLPRPAQPGPRRAFDALWRSTPGGARASRRPRALAAVAPGRFAEHWTRWRPDGGA